MNRDELNDAKRVIESFAPKRGLNEHQVYAHGKRVKIYVSPLKEILYRLRPKLPSETGKDRVAKVEEAEAAIIEAVERLLGEDEVRTHNRNTKHDLKRIGKNQLRATLRTAFKEWREA